MCGCAHALGIISLVAGHRFRRSNDIVVMSVFSAHDLRWTPPWHGLQMAICQGYALQPAAWSSWMLGPTTARWRRPLVDGSSSWSAPLATSIFYARRAVRGLLPLIKCCAYGHVEPRARDGASKGVRRGCVEVERVACGHRPGSVRPWEGAEHVCCGSANVTTRRHGVGPYVRCVYACCGPLEVKSRPG